MRSVIKQTFVVVLLLPVAKLLLLPIGVVVNHTWLKYSDKVYWVGGAQTNYKVEFILLCSINSTLGAGESLKAPEMHLLFTIQVFSFFLKPTQIPSLLNFQLCVSYDLRTTLREQTGKMSVISWHQSRESCQIFTFFTDQMFYFLFNSLIKPIYRWQSEHETDAAN